MVGSEKTRDPHELDGHVLLLQLEAEYPVDLLAQRWGLDHHVLVHLDDVLQDH